MNLPIEISPNPLIATGVEIRFTPKNNGENLFSKFLPVFVTELTTFENINQIPKDVKKSNPQFEFVPDFKLRNKNFSVAFSDNVFLIETVGEYPLWLSYFEFIKTQIKKLVELNIIDNIIRIGVRYRSIFQGKEVIEILKFFPKISITGYTEKIAHSRFDLIKDSINLHLQIAENAKFEKSGITLVGAYVDIDASYLLPVKPDLSMNEVIKDLHTAEKEFFFQILNPVFLQTLNPKY